MQEKNCWRDFANWKTFRRHLIQNHKYPVYVHPSSNKSDLSSIPIEDVESVVSSVITDNKIDDRNGGVSVESDISDALTIQLLKESVRNSLMTFVSKLYADPNLPRKHIQLIVDDLYEFLSDITTNLKSFLLNIVKRIESNKLKNEVDEVLRVVIEPFQDISSEYHRLKIFQEMGFYIPPESCIIGSRIDNKFFQDRIVKEIVPVTAQFIPMRKVLHKFFSLPGILEKTLIYVKELKTQKHLSNFVQGEIWREKESKFFLEMCYPFFYITMILKLIILLVVMLEFKK